MSHKSPSFPMPAEPHHFSDYGFDSQLDYFDQMLEEAARNHQRETLSKSIDDIISNDKKKKKRRWWWNKAFTTFFKWTTKQPHINRDIDRDDVHMARARAFRSNYFSGPLYMADSRPTQLPHHRSQPLIAGLLSPGGGGTGSGCSSPYLSLRELNTEHQHLQRMSASASPIYLVT